jgi:hypothetical protein
MLFRDRVEVAGHAGLLSGGCWTKAGDETRTRDIFLGKENPTSVEPPKYLIYGCSTNRTLPNVLFDFHLLNNPVPDSLVIFCRAQQISVSHFFGRVRMPS